MSDLDRFVLGLIIAIVAILALIAILARVNRWIDRRDLREYERRAEARLAEFRKEQRKRRHAAERAEFRERLRREKEGGDQ